MPGHQQRRRTAARSMSGPLLAALLVLGQTTVAAPPIVEANGKQPSVGPAPRVAQSDANSLLNGVVTKALEQLGGPNLGTAGPNSGEPLPTPPQAPARGFTIPLASPDGEDAIEISSDDGLVSLVVRDAPLRHVMALLADAHELSLVFASATDVPVTATLDRVPLGKAIDALLFANGYTWSLSGQVIYVTSTAEASNLQASVQGRRVAVLELDFASAADIDQGVKGLLSPVGKSWVLESNSADNRRTKEAIVVEDIESNLRRIERFVSEADQPPRQVLIEAHLLEVELDKEHRAGVDLSGLARISGSRLAARSVGLASATATPAFLIESTGGDLGLLVEAIITTTDAKTLARPRVLAVNGQQSRIQIGQQLGFRVTTTTQTSTLESVEFLNVGVVLTVTPRITRDGRVLMRIKPEVSSGVVNPATGLPEEETTELETDVLLADGQGMVIGGLIQETDDVVVSRVPVLSKLPYTGFLFERRKEVKRRTELIVALKPHVLPYAPIELCRNDAEMARCEDPLLYGKLCRNPRPYEPRLPGTISTSNKPRVLSERDGCPPNGAHRSSARFPAARSQAARCASAPAAASTLLRPDAAALGRSLPRRLPPVDQPSTDQSRIARRPAPTLVY